MASGPAGNEGRQDGVPQLVPGGGITKEAGHANQQLFEEQIQLLGVALQKPDVIRQLIDLVNAQPPLDPAVKGVFLVTGKIMARLGAQ